MAGITFNPQLTTSPYGTFDVSTQGYYQGDFVDDPSTRMELASGKIGASVAQPIYGGIAITESVATNGEASLGTTITIATAVGNLTGWTVFTQSSNAIVTPGNTVPQLAPTQTTTFFRLGSGARIKVAVLAAEVATIEAGNINQALYWDPALQELTASGTAGAITLAGIKVLSVNTNSKVVSYNAGTGVVSWVAGAVAVIQI